MTQIAGVEAQRSVLAANLQASKVTFLVDAKFQDLVLVDRETGEHFLLQQRPRGLPIAESRTYLRMLKFGLVWICRELQNRRCLPPKIIHIDLTIHHRDVVNASADFIFIRGEAEKWEYSPINIVPADAETVTVQSAF